MNPRKMRWLLAAGFTAAALVLVIPLARASSAPSPAHGTSHSAQARFDPCAPWTNYWQANQNGWNWATAWRTNPAGCWQRAALKCADRFGSTVWVNGPWHHDLYVFSSLNCVYPYDSPEQGNFDWIGCQPGPGCQGLMYKPEYYFSSRAKAAARAGEHPAECASVTISGNSGQGPNLYVHFCGTGSQSESPVLDYAHSLLVDGEPLTPANCTRLNPCVVLWPLSPANGEKAGEETAP